MNAASRLAATCLVVLLGAGGSSASEARVSGCARALATASETPCSAIVMRVSSALPLLPPGGAVGTLIGFDPKSQFAEFRISCGWDSRTHQKIAPGVWRLRLRGMGYDVELDPMGKPDTSNLASGHVVAVSRAAWERAVLQTGFSGFIELVGKPFVTDGPGTDVCHGVF